MRDAIHRHSFKMTRERVAEIADPLEAALWTQNERLYAALAPLRLTLRWVALLICVAGVALTLGCGQPWRRLEGVLPLISFLALIPVFVLLPVAELRIRRFAKGRCRAAAERMLAPVSARVPYEIHYELEGAWLRTSAPAIQARYELSLRSASVALASGPVVCLFRGRYSPAPFRVLYAPTGQERAILLDHLAAAQVRVQLVSEGPSSA